MTNTYDFVALLTKYTEYAKQYIQKVLPKKVSELENDAKYVTKNTDITGTANRAISDQNGNVIDQTYAKKIDVDLKLQNKADWGTKLADYQIKDAYTKLETDTFLSQKADADNVYTKEESDDALNKKADTSTTLAGYGIKDAYTKSEMNSMLSKKPDFTSIQKLYVAKSEKGVANGVATLNESGLIPANQLPSYVDDVIEGYYIDNVFYKDAEKTTLVTGEPDKIYVDIPNNKTYRYAASGNAYIQIGDSVSTAERAIKDINGNEIVDTYATKEELKDTTKPATKGTPGTVIIGDNLSVDDKGRISYELPIATKSELGGIKEGTDVTIDDTGILSVNYKEFTDGCTHANIAALWAP